MVKITHRKRAVVDVNGSIAAEYKSPMEEKIPARVAHLLDWCAKKFPGVPIAWNIVVKAVMGYRSTPTLKGKESEAMAARASAIRTKLMSLYGRGLVNARGQGVRATVSDDDVANTQLRGNMQRLVSAKAATERTLEIIDTSKIKSKELRAWTEKSVAPALKGLDAVNRLNALLPAAPTPATEKK